MGTEATSSKRGFLLKAVLGLAITTALLLLLFRYIDLQQLRDLLAAARWPLLLLTFLIWVLIYLGRAARFVLVAPRTPYSTMVFISMLHGFFLRLLPFRTGELAYAFLVRRAGTAGLGESLLSLVLLRLLDSTAVVIFFAAALAFHQGTYLGDRRLGLLAAGIAAAVGAFLSLALVPALRLALRLVRRMLDLTGLTRRPRIQRALEQTTHAIETFSSIRPALFLQISAISLVLWLLTFAAFFAMMRAFSMPVGVAQTVLGSTAAVVTGFLPIGGIGSFGTLEAGWALGFVLVGLEQTRAISSGFGVSIVTFGYGAILGLIGWIGLALVGRGRSQA